MKTHYALVENGNESNGGDEWGEPICGTQLAVNDLSVDNDWRYISCKKCQKLKKRFTAEIKMNMEDSCRDMAGYMEFIENKEGQEKISKALEEQNN